MTAYHGTPHRFPPTESNPLGEFDLSKIGTGEGAQAYGHGIYLAENPDIAGSYATSLSPAITDPHGGVGMAERILESSRDPDDALAEISRRREYASRLTDEPSRDDFIKRLDVAEQHIKSGETGSNIYDVDLPDEQIAKMLDWDAPLSEQPESVRKGIKQVVDYQDFDDFDNLALAAVRGTHPRGGYDPVGKDIYQELSDLYSDAGSLDPSAMASRELNSLGIPGLKYYDAGSRTAGEGTRNFVMFDPSVSTIIGRR
jgi:hypothetical protein